MTTPNSNKRKQVNSAAGRGGRRISSADTEQLPCLSCGAPSGLLFRLQDLNQRITDIQFNYYQCKKCQFIFIDEPPKDLARYYPSNYYALPDSIAVLERDAVREQYKIEIIKQFARGDRLVEVGPARGNFCYLAKQAGFKVTAIERDSGCCDFIRQVLDISVINADDEIAALEQVDLADIITLWHVIEHFRDPWRFMVAVSRKLKPGGLLVISTPNPMSLQFKIFGKFWAHVDAPRHLCLIPPQLLERKLTEMRLGKVWQTTVDQGSLDCDAFGWVYSISNLISGGPPGQLAWRFGRVAGIVAHQWEKREGRGTAYTAVFRKLQ